MNTFTLSGKRRMMRANIGMVTVETPRLDGGTKKASDK